MIKQETGSRPRGYFAIGIYRPKCRHNIGTLWRSAYQLGASEIFVIGPRWPKCQASDTCKTWRHVPFRRYEDVDDLVAHLPYGCQLIGVEDTGRDVRGCTHPQRACYLLGAEDHGLSPSVQVRCHQLIRLAAIGPESYNVAVAGSLVMWERAREIMATQDGY